MKMQGNYTLQAPRDKVWAFLMQPESMAKIMPGCERLEEVAPDTFEATLKLGIAAVQGTYAGTVQLLDKTAPSHFRMLIDGSGTAGFVKGEASIDLTEQDGLSKREQWLVAIYHGIKDWPVVHAVLLVVGPVLQMICVRRDAVTPADARPKQSAGTV